MFNFTKIATKARDTLADATGIRLIPDTIWHPSADEVCTLDIQGYIQIESYTCGYAAGAIILHTFHPDACLDKFFEQCNPDYDHGLEIKPLIRCLRANGIGVSEKHDLTFNKIVATLDEGFPIITLIRTKEKNIQHWVVIYGYGKNPNRIFMAGEGLPLLNRITGSQEIPWSEFSRSKWADKGFGLVCWGK
jgi:hypothetical protein